MTIHIRNLEWANHNAQRAYPLRDIASRQDSSGAFTIPNDFIVGLGYFAHAGIVHDFRKFHIYSIVNDTNGFRVVLGYDNVAVAAANIPRATHVPNNTYRLGPLTGDFEDATGIIQIGKLDGMDNQPPGIFQFDDETGQLEADVIRSLIRGVSSISVGGKKLYGDVNFVAGQNMRITAVGNTIVFDAIQGEGLNEECICEDDEDAAPGLRTINGIPGTVAGDFTLLGSTCVDFEPITNGLRVINPCSEPCCGCEELITVTQQLEVQSRLAQTLETFLVSLEARVTQMDSVVLGSLLGDRSCLSCE